MVLFLSFQYGCLLLFFSWLVALARTSLYNAEEKWWEQTSLSYSCSYPVLAFRLSPLTMILAVCLSQIPFILLRKFPSSSSLLNVFVMKKYWILSNWDLRLLFSLHSINVMYDIVWHLYSETPLYSWDKSHLIGCWFGLLVFCWGFSHLYA